MGKSLKEEEGSGYSEGEKTSLKEVTAEVTTVVLPVTKSRSPVYLAHPRVEQQGFSILCQITSFLRAVAEEGGGGLFPWHYTAGSRLPPGSSRWLGAAAGAAAGFPSFFKLLVETSYGLKPTTFHCQPSGSSS